MILTCPQCETRFVVPANAIPSEGRSVRCAKCQAKWHQLPVEDDDRVDVVKAPVITKTEETPKSDGKFALILASVKKELIEGYKPFTAGLAIVLALFFALTQFSGSAVVVGQGLAFHHVVIEREGSELAIRGEIVNSMNDVRGVPKIQLTTIFDGVDGDSFLIVPAKDVLEPNEQIEFTYVLTEADAAITDIKVGFVTAQDMSEETDEPVVEHPQEEEAGKASHHTPQGH